MMNRRSSRLIAWLLALVMVFNIFPVSALAGGMDEVPAGGTDEGKEIKTEELPSNLSNKEKYEDSDGPSKEYTVHHCLKGTETKVADDTTGTAAIESSVSVQVAKKWNGKTLLAGNEETKTFTISEENNEWTIYYTLPVTVTPNDAEWVLNSDEELQLTATVEGLLEGDTIDYDVKTPQIEGAGPYTIEAAGATEQGYYSITYRMGTLTVSEPEPVIDDPYGLSGKSGALAVHITEKGRNDYIAMNSVGNGISGRLAAQAVRVKDGVALVRQGEEPTIWTFVKSTDSEDGWYVISDNGSYLNVGTSNATLSMTSTPTEVHLMVSDGGLVRIRATNNERAVNLKSNKVVEGFQSSNYNKDKQNQFIENEYFHLLPVEYASKPVLTYDANGGLAEAPEGGEYDEGAVLILPDYDGTREGYSFIGWSESSDVKTGTYTGMYEKGEQYTMPAEDTTLYAVWSYDVPEKVRFGIRLDGKIPNEPGKFDTSAYSKYHAINDECDIKEKRWIVDTKADGEIVGNHLVNAVTRNLSWLPDDDEIRKMVSSYDPDTQYVHWYVMKWQWDPYWHIDGVILDRTSFKITYDQNAPGNASVDNMPMGFQVSENTTIKAGVDGSSNGKVKEPTCVGYTFTGWTTNKDGSGNNYLTNDSIDITSSITLFAQWAKGEVNVTVRKINESGKPLENASFRLEGDRISNLHTSENGVINLDNIKTDTIYTLTETTPPTGYKARAPFFFKVTEKNGQLVLLICNENGSEIDKPSWIQTTVGSNNGVKKFTLEITDEADVVSYTIRHYLKGTDVKVKETDSGTAVLGSEITVDYAKKYLDKDLTVDSHNPAQKVTISENGQEITIYYTLPLTIKAKTDGKVYDGIPLTGSYEVTGELNTDQELVERLVKALPVPSVTKVTDSPKIYPNEEEQADIISRLTDIPPYYHVSFEEGTLSITAAGLADEEKFTVSNPESVKYDGQEHRQTVTVKYGETVLNAEDYDIQYSEDVTNAGTVIMTITGKGNYAGTVEKTYEITKRNITIVAASEEFTYDGQTHNNPKVTEILETVKTENQNENNEGTANSETPNEGEAAAGTGNTPESDGLAEGDTLNATATGSVKDVVNAVKGNNPIAAGFTITRGTKNVTENYSITTVPGTLSVIPKEVTVTADNKERTNRPNETDPDFTATIDGLVDGENTDLIQYTLSRKEGDNDDLGDHAIIVTASVNQGNYVVKTVNGILNIQDATVPLYNVALVKANGAAEKDEWYKLAITNPGILTEKSLDSYVKEIKSGKEKELNTSQYNASAVSAYDFRSLTIDFNGYLYVFSNGNDPGVDYYTVEENAIWVSKEVGGSAGWLVPSSQQFDSKTVGNCFVRKYTITLHHALKTQKLINLLAVGDATKNYYRLKVGMINAPEAEKFKDGYSGLSEDQYSIPDGDYDFTGVVLDIGTKKYTYSASEKTGVYDPYFTIVPKDGTQHELIIKKSYIHGGSKTSSWFNTSAGWLLGAENSFAENGITSNEYVSWHRDYRAELHEGKTYSGRITVTAKSDSKPYDGSELKNTGYDVVGLPDGYTLTATVAGSATNVGDDGSNKVTAYTITDNDGNNVTKFFTNVKMVDGKLRINKRSVTLTSATDEKVYDSRALTNEEVTVGGNGFAAGEGASYTVTGSQTEVGETPNAFTYTLNEGTKADNYEITKTPGSLKVTPVTDKVTVTITENGGSAKYDGSEKTAMGYKVEIDNGLYTEADFTFNGDATVKGISAGSYPMELKSTDFTNNSENFTNVEFVIVDGALEISKRTVTLTSSDDEKVYDSTALTNEEVTVGGDGFAAGEGASYDVTGSQTEVGETPNAFTYTLNEGTKADNYEITKTPGTLKVTPVTDKVTVTITENGGSAKYDGSEKTATGYKVEIDNGLYTEADFTFNGDATVKGTDAGSYPMELKSTDFTNNSENFTNVEFVIVDGALEISKRTVTLTSSDDEKVYDSTALTNEEVTVGGDGFAAGEGASYDVTGSQTEVGETPNAFTYTLNEGTKADNYEITKTPGTLKVTPVTDKVTVTITENGGSAKYDGSEKTAMGYKVEIDNGLYTEADFTFNGDATVKGISAGSYPMELKSTDFTNNSENFTNVEFVIVDGALEISKRTVTLTSSDDEKVYDSTALTNEEVTVGGDGFAAGEGASYDVTGSQTEVGETPNAFTYTLNEGTKADNYEITKTPGTLKVTPADLSGEDFEVSQPVNVKYNGGEQKQAVTVTRGTTTLTEGTDYTVNYSNDVTNVGTVIVTIRGIGNYEGIVNRSYSITARNITMTSATDNKVYDGTALTRNAQTDVTVTGDGFVADEGAMYNITGSQTDFGTSDNAFTYTLNEGTLARNYNIQTVYGTLSVTKATMPLTVTGYEGTYDGETHSVVVNAPTGSTIQYSVDGGVTWTDEVPGITDAGEAVTVQVQVTNSNYDPETREVTLKLDKAPVTITTGGGERMYNGATLTNAEAGIAGLVNGETATVTATGTILNAGSTTNTYGIAWGTAKADNYVITENLGTLEVTPRTVTLTSASDSKAYDGGALTKNTQADVTVGGDGFVAGEGAVYTITGRQTTVGSSDNLFVYTLNPGTLARNYSITPSYGTLTVLEAENEEPAGGGLPGGGLPGTDLPGGGTGTENTPEGGNTPGTTGGRGVQNYTLTITYQTSDGTVLNTFERTYANGQQYEVRSPERPGYTVDIDTVFGTINGLDVSRTVTYTPAAYTLTVYVQSITNGAIVGEPIVRTLVAGEAYSVAIPEVDGYTLLSGSVEGTMPASNREITVFAIPAGTNPGGAKVIQIEDYGTPLGIAESILGSGEIIE